ncbi:MAG TPA: 23S rRNA (adenine(1618)-N(6))-methyltransferase RlmF [Flavobacterium sp.]|jgi:23S rRNA (adenine1618-N6)-methyltransferase
MEESPKPNIEKVNLHPRNIHRNGYNYSQLVKVSPELQHFISTNKFGNEAIDFSDANAVKALNKALLMQYYKIENWDIPDGFLCPPIPGRADYIHSIADLLAESNEGEIPMRSSVLGLDIGVGANCIYPIIGNAINGWDFVGTDISKQAIANCVQIFKWNPLLMKAISLQQQMNSRFIFKDIIQPDDKFAFTMCNPPFHSSAEEASKANARKIGNLSARAEKNLNFGGQHAELWCDGGELAFITQMIYESAKYPTQCLWFTTLVSKGSNLPAISKILKKVNVAEIRIVEMSQGQKSNRFIAWTFLSEEQKKNWKF